MFCKVVLGFVLLAVASHAAVAEDFKNDIPELCLTMSKSPVSCADMDPLSVDAELRPHPDECTLFYFCVEPARAPICRKCPAGLHFNAQERVCDQPEHAGCQ